MVLVNKAGIGISLSSSEQSSPYFRSLDSTWPACFLDTQGVEDIEF